MNKPKQKTKSEEKKEIKPITTQKTLGSVYNIYNAYGELEKCKELPFGISWLVDDLRTFLKPLAIKFETRMNGILQKFGTPIKSENGQVTYSVKDPAGYTKAVEELSSSIEEIPVYLLKPVDATSLTNIPTLQISVYSLRILREHSLVNPEPVPVHDIKEEVEESV